MLNEYLARQRVSEWRRVAAQHQLLANSRPERHAPRHRGRGHRIWTRAPERPPVQV